MRPQPTTVARTPGAAIHPPHGGRANPGIGRGRLAAIASLLALTLITAPAWSATATRSSKFEYDVSGRLLKEIVEPGNPDLCLVTTHGYDSFGNRNTSTQRNCQQGQSNETGPASGSATFDARTKSADYDIQGRFPLTSTNALNKTETRTYDDLGNVKSHTDPNGVLSQWQYDSLGRKTLEIRPDLTRTAWSYEYCSNLPPGTCPAYAKYLIQTTPQNTSGTKNGAYTKIYYNALGNEVRRETEGHDGSLIRSDTEYTALKRIDGTSRPYYIGQALQWTRYSYDPLGRTITETRPDGSTLTHGYSGLTTTVTASVTPSLTQTKITQTDSQGRTAALTDDAGKILQYRHDPLGNLVSTTDPDGNTIKISYNLRGHKLALIDPDLGKWTYVHDALGQLVAQTDAKGQTATLEYDKLGRLTRRSEPGLVSTWTHDACANGIGKLCQSTTDTGYNQTLSYDIQGRPIQTSTTIDAVYPTAVSYDGNGRLATQSYPTGLTVKYDYTNTGYLSKVSDYASNALYWQANTRDAEGHLLTQTAGNGVETLQDWDPANGRIRSIATGAGNSVQDFHYEYDLLGNVKVRTDVRQSLIENFDYDNRNRLTKATVNSGGAGIVIDTYGYDSLGNITLRSDLGNYSYNVGTAGCVRPHAVTQVAVTAGGTRQYTYDGNGNLTQENLYSASGAPIGGRTLTYKSFNMPARIIAASATADFYYGPEHQRVMQVSTRSGTTIYLNPDSNGGLLYEKDTKPDLSVEHRHFITAEGQVVAVIKQTSAGTTVSYLHRDNLGSTTAVTNEAGTVVESLAYEPFGKRRVPDGQDDPAGLIYPVGLGDPANNLVALTTERGFTNHEHLDELGLIHMNGRIYDPLLGRFTSADPTTPNPLDLQSYNRYSYTRNNPLRMLDPSGFSDEGLLGLESGATRDQHAVAAPKTMRDNVCSRTLDATRGGDQAVQPEANREKGLLERIGDSVKGTVKQAQNDLEYSLNHPLQTFENTMTSFGLPGAFAVGTLKMGGKLAAIGARELQADAALTRAAETLGVNAAKEATAVGRAGRQERLRELANDTKLGSADRGWIKQEINSIERGQRASIRNPPGKDLAHERGREAAKGYDYGHSNLQDRGLHRLQHKYDDFGRANAERPIP